MVSKHLRSSSERQESTRGEFRSDGVTVVSLDLLMYHGGSLLEEISPEDRIICVGLV